MVEVQQLSAEQIAARKKRNIWLALALLAFVILVGITSVIRIQDVDYSKSDGFYLDAAIPKKNTELPKDAE